MPRKIISDEEILTLACQGVKGKDIAKRLGVTPGTISQRLIKLHPEIVKIKKQKEEAVIEDIKQYGESCENCINSKRKIHSGHCRTMTERPSELFCHMTEKQAKKAEDAIKRYSFGKMCI